MSQIKVSELAKRISALPPDAFVVLVGGTASSASLWVCTPNERGELRSWGTLMDDPGEWGTDDAD